MLNIDAELIITGTEELEASVASDMSAEDPQNIKDIKDIKDIKNISIPKNKPCKCKCRCQSHPINSEVCDETQDN